MCLPPEVHHLIIDNLVHGSGRDDSTSRAALRQCMIVSKQFYAYTRPLLFSQCRLTFTKVDLENPNSTLLERFVTFISKTPTLLNLRPLTSTMRSLEVVAILEAGSQSSTLLSETLNSNHFVTLLEFFLEQDTQIDSLSFKIESLQEDRLNWDVYGMKGGCFAQAFTKLCSTKIQRLRLRGIRNLPNTFLYGISSVKHLTMDSVFISDGRKASPTTTSNNSSLGLTNKFNPSFLDLCSISMHTADWQNPILHFLFPSSNLRVPNMQPRFPNLRELRLHWSVVNVLAFLDAAYKNAPQLEIVHALGPSMMHSSDPPFHGFTTLEPPPTLLSFNLAVIIAILPTDYDDLETVRWPNFRTLLEVHARLPKMKHIGLQVRFARSTFAREPYWIFEQPVAHNMWREIAVALSSCTTAEEVDVDIALGNEFDLEKKVGYHPAGMLTTRGEREIVLVETCLYKAFEPLFAAKPQAKFKLHFLEDRNVPQEK